MRPVKLEDYTIPARGIAENLWGRGGTTSYRTNRHGAYYYSCSAHGGYVVDGRVLTDEEKKNIEQYIKPDTLPLAVQHRESGDIIIGASLSWFGGKNKRITYNPFIGEVEWLHMPVYIFEEDIDWCVLEKFTDIRAKGGMLSPEDQKQVAESTFNTWIVHRAERLNTEENNAEKVTS